MGEASARAHEVCFLCYLVVRIVTSLVLFIHIKMCFCQTQSKARVSQRLWSRSNGVGVSRSLRGGRVPATRKAARPTPTGGTLQRRAAASGLARISVKETRRPRRPRAASTHSLHAHPGRLRAGVPRGSPHHAQQPQKVFKKNFVISLSSPEIKLTESLKILMLL